MTCMALKEIKAHTDDITSIAFAPNNQVFATGSRLGAIKLWALSGELRLVLELPSNHTYRVDDLAFSMDSTGLAPASADRSVCIWELVTGALVTGPL